MFMNGNDAQADASNPKAWGEQLLSNIQQHSPMYARLISSSWIETRSKSLADLAMDNHMAWSSWQAWMHHTT